MNTFEENIDNYFLLVVRSSLFLLSINFPMNMTYTLPTISLSIVEFVMSINSFKNKTKRKKVEQDANCKLEPR
jgi:mannose/fructose/N-acetylgalactosamine-specific phosphotransferase system component IIC